MEDKITQHIRKQQTAHGWEGGGRGKDCFLSQNNYSTPVTASQQFFSQIVISTSIKAIIFVAGTRMYWIVKMVNSHQNVLQILTGQYKKKVETEKKVRDQLFD